MTEPLKNTSLAAISTERRLIGTVAVICPGVALVIVDECQRVGDYVGISTAGRRVVERSAFSAEEDRRVYEEFRFFAPHLAL